MTDEIFNSTNFEVEGEVSKEGEVIEFNGVKITQFQPEWTDAILNLLQADELDGEHPKVDGLRRVAQLIYGPFFTCSANVITTPSIENGFTATVAYTIVTQNGQRQYTEVADCNPQNTKAPYCYHAPATASTKAEGRALRKLLNLKKLSAEEVASNPPELEKDDEDADMMSIKIKDFQINRLNLICERSNINVMNFVNSGANKFEKIEDVPYTVAQKMFNVLVEYQRDNSKISDKIKGYDPNWRGS